LGILNQVEKQDFCSGMLGKILTRKIKIPAKLGQILANCAVIKEKNKKAGDRTVVSPPENVIHYDP
jgi:hypothetical protein